MNAQLFSTDSEVHATLGAYARKVIRHEFEHIAKQEEAVLEDADIEPLHKMRVGMRRLRAAFNTFSPAIALPKKAAIQVIAEVSKQLGSTRDWDVMKHALKEDYRPLLSGTEQDRLDRTLNRLKKCRKRSFKQLEKALTGSRYKTLKRSLQDWLDDPTFETIAELPIDLVLPDLLLPMTSQLLLHPGWWVVPPEFSSAQVSKTSISKTPISKSSNIEQGLESKVLHSLRKLVKEIRYQSEFFETFYPPAYTDYIEDLKSIQELLGQLQDCTVLREFLTDELKTSLEDVLPTVAHRFQQTKHQAWENWQPLRQRFIDAAFRQELRSQILHPCYPSSESQQD
jgi:CHAD domain-containing protein